MVRKKYLSYVSLPKYTHNVTLAHKANELKRKYPISIIDNKLHDLPEQ